MVVIEGGHLVLSMQALPDINNIGVIRGATVANDYKEGHFSGRSTMAHSQTKSTETTPMSPF